MPAYERFLSSTFKSITPAGWDALIRQISNDIAGLQDAKSAQTILADALLARGLQVIEDLIEPVALDAQQKDASITDILNAAAGNGQQIADILSALQSGGVSADVVSETVARKWLTATLKATYDGYAAQIAAKATPQDITDAIDALVDGAPTALDTLNEIAAKLADDDSAIAALTSSLSNRLRIDTATQGLTSTQIANALANLGATTLGKTLLAIADAAAARTALGLGSAATLTAGTGANNVPQLDGSGHLPSALLAATADAQAGTDANKLMTPARTAEAITALAASGWKQIGTTQTLAADVAYVEQTWTVGAYREVLCLASLKPVTNGTSLNASLLNGVTSIASIAGAANFGNTNMFPSLFRAVLSSVAIFMQWNASLDSGGAIVLPASAPDRMRIGPFASGNIKSGSQFMFFGMK